MSLNNAGFENVYGFSPDYSEPRDITLILEKSKRVKYCYNNELHSYLTFIKGTDSKYISSYYTN